LILEVGAAQYRTRYAFFEGQNLQVNLCELNGRLVAFVLGLWAIDTGIAGLAKGYIYIFSIF
jgi:hypothetical protein